MKTYKKRLGLFRNPEVLEEIKRLDPERDHQRIVHLMLCYDFAFDMVRANELALFATYASISISGLLDRTGEFSRQGQKRYDDTRFLITKFVEDGYDGPFGQRAIAQMNKIHGQFRIPNDDYLYVLSTFVFYPINWLDRYAWRPMLDKEKLAIFYFFREVGLRMGMQQVPADIEAMRTFAEAYEQQYMVYADSNRRVAEATIGVFKGWFPAFLSPIIEPAVSVLLSDRIRMAFGFSKPRGWFRAIVTTALSLRKYLMRIIPVTFMPYPSLAENTRFRTYSPGPLEIEGVRPSYMKD